MKRELKVLTRPYLLGLLTTLFLVTSVAMMSRPLFKPSDNATQAETATTTQKEEAAFKDLMTISDIQEVASADGTGVGIEKIELRGEGDDAHYVVGMANGQVLAYDAVTGDLLTGDNYRLDHKKETLPANYRAAVDFARARSLGAEKVPDAKVQKIEVEVESGSVIYIVRFDNDTRVIINADDGKVAEVRTKADKADDAQEGRVQGSSNANERATERTAPQTDRSNGRPNENANPPAFNFDYFNRFFSR